jgi:hypothetical protein
MKPASTCEELLSIQAWNKRTTILSHHARAEFEIFPYRLFRKVYLQSWPGKDRFWPVVDLFSYGRFRPKADTHE